MAIEVAVAEPRGIGPPAWLVERGDRMTRGWMRIREFGGERSAVGAGSPRSWRTRTWGYFSRGSSTTAASVVSSRNVKVSWKYSSTTSLE
jgi:hypothetical protein